MKQKKCRQCKSMFLPSMTTQVVCSPKCANEYAKGCRKKEFKRETRKLKEKVKSHKEWSDEAQAAVNKYVRLRDRHLGCISCDKPADWNGQWHASHFRSRGAASSIRFNLWNIHKSCSICNHHLSGNIGEYEPRLRAKIGNEKVDWLKSQNGPARFDIEYLKRLKAVFTKKIRMIEKRIR